MVKKKKAQIYIYIYICVCVCNRMPKGKRNNTASKLSKAPLPIYRLQQSEAVLLSKYMCTKLNN